MCRRRPPSFDLARSSGVYEDDLRRLIHLFKYERMRPLAAPLAESLVPLVERLRPLDLMVPVPLPRSRRWSRGFNQAEALARELRRGTGIPVAAKVLRRVRFTRPQAGLSHRERRQNVAGVFALRQPAAIADRRILLVDDVMTTGATLDACAAVLKKGGARFVAAVTAARAPRRVTEWDPVTAAAAISRQRGEDRA